MKFAEIEALNAQSQERAREFLEKRALAYAGQSAGNYLGVIGTPTGDVPDWPLWMLNHPYVPPEYVGDWSQAFRKVPIVAAAISMLQHDVASLPRAVWRGEGLPKAKKEKPADGTLSALMLRPNPWQSPYQFIVDTIGSLWSVGSAYWYMFRDTPTSPPSRVWVLPAQNWRVTPTSVRGVLRYEYNRGGYWEPMLPENVLHFRNYNPDDEPVGMSPLEPVRRAFEAEFYAILWLKEFFRKGGMASGVWKIDDPVGKMASKTPEQLRAIGERIDQRTQGYEKAWNSMVVESLQFIKRGMTMQEMDLEGMLNVLNCMIARAIGVPPWMLGLKEKGGLGQASAQVDERAYWTGPCARTAELIQSTVNSQLVGPLPGQFPEGLTLKFDFSRVPAIQGARLEQSKGLVLLAGRPVFTADEAREIMDHEPRDPAFGEDADKLFTPAAPVGLSGAGLNEKPGAGGAANEPAKGEGVQQARRERSVALSVDGRTQLRRKAAAALDRHEARMLAFLSRRMGRQEAQSLERFRSRWHHEHPAGLSRERVRLAIDLQGLFDQGGTDAESERVREVLRDLMDEVGAERVSELEDDLNVAQVVDVAWHSARAVSFLDTQVNRAIIVPDGTSDTVLRASLAEGIAAGEGLGELEQRVRDVWKGRENMAATIARTETAPAYNFASLEVWRANADVLEGVEWLTAEDDAVRETHVPLDGVVIDVGDTFKVGDDELEYPGDPSGSAGEVINCYLPGTRVRGLFVAGVRSKYEGPAREIVTRSGQRLRLTPNHPVLTGDGMCRAGDLRKTDYLVGDRSVIHADAPTAKIHQQYEPAAIEDVFEALRVGVTSSRLHLRADDLHGDARFVVGQVHVVGTDRELLFDRMASPAKDLGDRILIGEAMGESRVSRSGSRDLRAHGVGRSAPGLPRGRELATDSGGVALEPLPFEPLCFGLSADWDTILLELAEQGRSTNARFIRELLQRRAALVALDEIVEVRDFYFSGHVYDLQSTSGLMIAENIVGSNCRCTLEPVAKEELARRTTSWQRWMRGGKASLNGHRNGALVGAS